MGRAVDGVSSALSAVQRFFTFCEMSIFECLRKRKKINTSDDQNHYKHSIRRTYELTHRQTQATRLLRSGWLYRRASAKVRGLTRWQRIPCPKPHTDGCACLRFPNGFGGQSPDPLRCRVRAPTWAYGSCGTWIASFRLHCSWCHPLSAIHRRRVCGIHECLVSIPERSACGGHAVIPNSKSLS